jgi:hypothetical protein
VLSLSPLLLEKYPKAAEQVAKEAVLAPGEKPGAIRVDAGKLAGSGGLKKVLLGKKALFTRTLTERMLTFALGRGIERGDRCNLDAMAAAVARNDYKFSAVVEAVVTSPPFRERRTE